MSTLLDVADFRVFVWQVCELHGATAEFQEEFSRRFSDLGHIIRAEKGYTRGEAMRRLKLSPATPLGPLAEARFQELQAWISSLKPLRAVS